MDMSKARRLIRDAAPYQLIAGQLYKQGKDGVLRRCVREGEFIPILDEAHSRPDFEKWFEAMKSEMESM